MNLLRNISITLVLNVKSRKFPKYFAGFNYIGVEEEV